jgi:hypothetical protein
VISDARARAVAVAGTDAADDLDAYAPPGAGTAGPLLRLLAATIYDLLDQLDHQPHGAGACPCGAAIAQPATGRRRLWCHTCRPPRNPAKRHAGPHADHT